MNGEVFRAMYPMPYYEWKIRGEIGLKNNKQNLARILMENIISSKTLGFRVEISFSEEWKADSLMGEILEITASALVYENKTKKGRE